MENQDMCARVSDLKAGDPILFKQPKKFEFVKSLQAGGTGKTILIRDTVMNELFVCKKYAPLQKQYEEEFYDRFLNEIKIMYSIYHESIVRIYDYFLYPKFKTGYILMEFISGVNIDEYFQFANPEKINSIFVQIVNAFAYLETKGILHRDLRANNILIDSSGAVKIIDFGFGKRSESDGNFEQASILLNWSASKVPQEIQKEVYDGKTEIFYVGYLIKNIIEKYTISEFKYASLLDRMIKINPNDRIKSFETIKDNIAQQSFEEIKFTSQQKGVYRKFAISLCNSLHSLKDNLNTERDYSVIIEKMRILLRDNSLEEDIMSPEELISIFIKSSFSYVKQSHISVDDVKGFYNFFVNQTDAYRDIILNNLYGRIAKTPVDNWIIDEELPFN